MTKVGWSNSEIVQIFGIMHWEAVGRLDAIAARRSLTRAEAVRIAVHEYLDRAEGKSPEGSN
jgi:hypothetical protein